MKANKKFKQDPIFIPMNNNTIEIEARSVYGKTNYYVVSAQAQHIARLTGKKTIDLTDMIALEQLGFTLVSAAPASIRLVSNVEIEL